MDVREYEYIKAKTNAINVSALECGGSKIYASWNKNGVVEVRQKTKKPNQSRAFMKLGGTIFPIMTGSLKKQTKNRI